MQIWTGGGGCEGTEGFFPESEGFDDIVADAGGCSGCEADDGCGRICGTEVREV